LASAGNSARGIPKIIAFRSMAKVESSAGRLRAKRRPSITARRPGADPPPCGVSAGSRAAAITATANTTAASA
jgi:hypothetical protein